MVMKVLFISSLIFFSCASSTLDVQQPSKFFIGGEEVAIPSPVGRLVQVDSEIHELFEAFVPNGGRLVVGFSDVPDLQSMIARHGRIQTSERATVGVMRLDEYQLFSSEEFDGICDLLEEQFAGSFWKDVIPEVERQLNERLAGVSGTSSVMSLEDPILVGTVLRRPDAIAYAMVMSGDAAGESMVELVTSGLVRVRGRLMFLNYYTGYEGSDSVLDAARVMDAWVTSIASANM